LLHEIGSIDDPDQTLTRVTTVRLAEDGRLLIGQPEDAQVRVHAPDGSFLNMIGQGGEGPGEVGRFGDFGLREGGIWLHDAGNQRMYHFRIDGTFVDGEPWAQVVERVDPVAFLWGIAGLTRAPDGSAIVTPGFSVRPGDAQRAESILRRIPVRRMTSGEVGDTVFLSASPYATEAPSGAVAVVSSSALTATGPDAERIFWVHRTTEGNPEPGQFEVGAVSVEGDTLFSRTFSYEPIPAPRARLREEYLGARSEAVQERIRDRLWVPETYPAVSTSAVTSDGLYWIGRERDQEPRTWWGLDPDTGEHVAIVRLPESERILDQRGDVLVTRRVDEFDVPYVRRYRIIR